MLDRPVLTLEQRRPSSGAGLASIILGVLGIVFGIVFVPVGLIFAVVAMAKGQVALGITGLLTNLFALATSVWFWGLFAISAGFTLFSW